MTCKGLRSVLLLFSRRKVTCKALPGSIRDLSSCRSLSRKNGSLLLKNRSLLLRGTYSYSLYASLCAILIKPARVDLRSVVADSGPINRFGVWTQPVMYGSLEPRDFTANSKHQTPPGLARQFVDLNLIASLWSQMKNMQ